MKNIILITLLGILFASCDNHRADVMLLDNGQHVNVRRAGKIEAFSDTVVVKRVYRESLNRTNYKLFGSYVGVMPKDTMIHTLASDFYTTYHKAVLLK
jgi:hypothetical protein